MLPYIVPINQSSYGFANYLPGVGPYGQLFVDLGYHPPTTSPAPNVPVVTGQNPVETAFNVYGKVIPLSVLGLARIGGLITVGPWIVNDLASGGVSFGVPADPTGTRTLTEIAFDSEVVWTLAGGFSNNSFTFRFYPGTYTQAADALETAHFGADAVAYRPQMMLFIDNLPLTNTKFKKFPYIAATILDGTGEDVALGEAFERIAYSPWVGYTSSQFVTSGITDALVDGGLLFADQAEFLQTIQNFARFYSTWDILQTDKLRIVDRGASVTPDITLNKTRLMNNLTVNRLEPNSVPRELELTTIDPDADYTLVPSRAQRPRVPVAVTTSVGTETAFLPAVMDSPTRLSLVTYAKYHEEQARKKITGVAMTYGLQMEPGDLVAVTGLGADFEDETFKVIETLHGANYAVEFTAESILNCSVAVSSGSSTPGTGPTVAIWAVSRSRVLIAGYAGSLDSVVSGRVQQLYDQSGNGRHIAASLSGSRPIATTSGPNSRSCCFFSPTSVIAGHMLQTSAGVFASSVISASTGYMVCSIRPDVVTQTNAPPYVNQNATILAFASGGMTARSSGVLDSWNDDGSIGGGVTTASSAASAVPIGGLPCVIEWRHQGGQIYQRVNGGHETQVTSGNTATMSVIRLGGSSGTDQWFNGKIFEAMIYQTVPTLAERDAIVADMMLWVGA